MPRGRGRGPRTVKPRLSRMDAAVDAMLLLGFKEETVKKHAKELLEVYGGDEGWPFIEECSYKVLLEYLLEQKDDQENVLQNGDVMQVTKSALKSSSNVDNEFCLGAVCDKDSQQHKLDNSCGNEEASCSSNRASDTKMAPPDVVDSSAAVSETPTTTPVPVPTPSPTGNRRTSVPCYGWIDSDDDDDEMIDFKPAVESVAEPVHARATLDVTKWTKKRRSRWDVKPGDP